MEPSFMVRDPPDHTRLRRLVAKAFTPRAVREVESRAAGLVDDLISAAAPHGRLDLVADLARPLPITLICWWLGIPAEDHDMLREWTESASVALDPYAVTRRQDVTDAVRAEELTEEYFRALVARRRAAPGPDLVSALIAARDEGDLLSDGELLATLSLVLVAGHETAINLIANGLLALTRADAELSALRAHPGRAGLVVDEVLRHDPPVQLTTRRTTEETRFGDVTVPEDSRLAILFAAANRDPAVHAEPGRFWVDRPRRPHLSFSAGAHYCLGAGLGRMQAALVFTRFAARLVGPVLHEDTVEYRRHVNLRGPDRAVVTFDDVLPVRP
jgi:cytochrome P450